MDANKFIIIGLLVFSLFPLASGLMCYQESPDAMPVWFGCDEIGYDNGTYNYTGDWDSPTAIYDEGWEDYAGSTYTTEAWYYVNYTLPERTGSAYLRIAFSNRFDLNIAGNYTIPSECLQPTVELRINATTGHTLEGEYWQNVSCWTGNDWIEIVTAQYAEYVYEEAIWWNILPEVDWQTSINTSIDKFSAPTDICINASENIEGTITFDGDDYDNDTLDTIICWDVPVEETGYHTFSYIVGNSLNFPIETDPLAVIDNEVTENGFLDVTSDVFNTYCPRIACTNTPITIWAMYEYNQTPYNDSLVFLDDGTAYQLFWNLSNRRYQADFESDVETTWNYNISTGDYWKMCSTEFKSCYNLTINLWEEVPTDRLPGSQVRVKNYDKQMNDRYVNDFAYLIAKNNDINISELTNESCNLPFGSGQKFLEILNMGNWMGENLSRATANLFGGSVGCDNYWFRAPYLEGTSTIKLPYTGNYSLWLIDGVMLWNNEYSPPDIVKSDLFLYLGDLDIDVPIDQTQDFWVSHAELDFWESIFASLYFPMLLIIPIIIIVTPFIFGIPFRFAIGLALAWMVIWTILRLNGI